MTVTLTRRPAIRISVGNSSFPDFDRFTVKVFGQVRSSDLSANCDDAFGSIDRVAGAERAAWIASHR